MLTASAISMDLSRLVRRHGLSVRLSEEWLTFGGEARSSVASAIALWKPAASDGDGRRLVFDVPAAALRDEGTIGDGDSSLLEALVEWAAETLHGRTPSGWSAPERQEVLELVRADPACHGLSFRAGDLMEQGRLECADGRLALRLTLARCGGEVSPGRRRWLERIIADTASLRVVRVAAAAHEAAAIEASVDLTGAPAPALGSLIEAALAALAHSYTWLAGTLSIVCDASWPSRALEEVAAVPLQPHSQES